MKPESRSSNGTSPSGRARSRMVRRPGRGGAAGARRGSPLRPPAAGRRCRPRRLPRAPRSSRRTPRRSRPARRLQPPRLALRHAGRRPREIRQALAPCSDPATDRPARASVGRPRSCGHGSTRRLPRRARRAPARALRGLLRRRRGASVPPRLVAPGAVHGSLRREADPPPRPRDDPGGCPTPPGARLPDRRQRPARPPPRRPAAERGVGALDRVPAAPGGVSRAPRARSGSSARRTRRSA